MGMYAQTNIDIQCQDNKSAKAVAEAIIKLKEDNNNGNDEDLNYAYDNLKVSSNYVFLLKDSGRIQNLEYQCEVLWEVIKGIKGIIEMNAPFMAEADGMYFSVEEDEDAIEGIICNICGKTEDDDGRCACTNSDSK